jgi:hypothetical protein
MKRIVFALVALLVLTSMAFAEPKRITRANVADPDRLEVILNAMDTEIDALRVLCNQQRAALLGYITIIKTDGAFTPGTTALNAANTTTAYTNTGTLFSGITSGVVAERTTRGK